MCQWHNAYFTIDNGPTQKHLTDKPRHFTPEGEAFWKMSGDAKDAFVRDTTQTLKRKLREWPTCENGGEIKVAATGNRFTCSVCVEPAEVRIVPTVDVEVGPGVKVAFKKRPPVSEGPDIRDATITPDEKEEFFEAMKGRPQIDPYDLRRELFVRGTYVFGAPVLTKFR